MSLFKNKSRSSIVFDKIPGSHRNYSVRGAGKVSARGIRLDVVEIDEAGQKLIGSSKLIADETLVKCSDAEIKAHVASLAPKVEKKAVTKGTTPPDLTAGIAGGSSKDATGSKETKSKDGKGKK